MYGNIYKNINLENIGRIRQTYLDTGIYRIMYRHWYINFYSKRVNLPDPDPLKEM